MPLWGTTIDLIAADAKDKEKLSKFLSEEKPDVVHFHTPWTPRLTWQVYKIIRQLRDKALPEKTLPSDTDSTQSREETPKPRPRPEDESAKSFSPKLIATFHDTPPENLLGRFLGSIAMPLAARFILPKFDEVVSVSEVQKPFIAKWSKKTVHVIPNGIELNGLNSDAELTSDVNQKTLLFLGRLEGRKGVMHAIQVFEQVRKSHENVRLIVAGDGNEREKAESYVKVSGLENVEFRGFVSEKEKQNLLKKADIFLAPALYGESFGIVLLEAMLAHTVVAGYGNPGYLSVVSDYAPENFPTPGDVDSLSARVSILLSDEALCEELVARGNELVKRYDWDVISGKILALY